jgi:hypothetical protein
VHVPLSAQQHETHTSSMYWACVGHSSSSSSIQGALVEHSLQHTHANFVLARHNICAQVKRLVVATARFRARGCFRNDHHLHTRNPRIQLPPLQPQEPVRHGVAHGFVRPHAFESESPQHIHAQPEPLQSLDVHAGYPVEHAVASGTTADWKIEGELTLGSSDQGRPANVICVSSWSHMPVT